MRCLVAVVFIFMFFFNESESSSTPKKFKVKNASSSKEVKAEINLEFTPRCVRKPDSRKPMVTFKNTKDPEETYHLYGQYYASHTEPPVSSGNAALELYHQHFTDRPKHSKYDHYGRFASRVTLEQAHVNYKTPLGQHLHPRDSSRSPSGHPEFQELPFKNNPSNVGGIEAYNLFKKYYGKDPNKGSGAGSGAGYHE